MHVTHGQWRVDPVRRGYFLAGVVAVVGAFLLLLALNAGSFLVISQHIEAPNAILILASHEWERIPTAASLAKESPDAVVLLTEPTVATPQNCHRCTERGTWLQELGIGGDRVSVLPDRVTNTYDEVAAAVKYCRNKRLQRLIVVTSPYHTRRVATVLRHHAQSSEIRFGIAAARPPRWASPQSWWTDPYDRAYVTYEVAAVLWYALRYGINPIVVGAHSLERDEGTVRQHTVEVEPR